MKIYIGADHAGFELKKKLKYFLKRLKYNVIDLGNKEFNKDDDYPIFAGRVALKVAKEKNSLGILICGSGQGVCIAANKVKGVRAALCEHIKDAFTARNDDDCNVLCLQARGISLNENKKVVKKFLETEFEDNTRRKRRKLEIKRLE